MFKIPGICSSFECLSTAKCSFALLSTFDHFGGFPGVCKMFKTELKFGILKWKACFYS